MRLEVELVTKGDLEDGVVVVVSTINTMLVDFRYTPIVAGVEHNVLIFIAQTYRNRKIKCVDIVHIVFVYHKAWLYT